MPAEANTAYRQYDDRWVASARGRALSLSLPFAPGNPPHRGSAVRAYFENLLPDSKDIRERVARRYRADSTDAFDLLAQVGRDCAGALQLLPEGMAPEDATSVQATPWARPTWPDCCARRLHPALWPAPRMPGRKTCAFPSPARRRKRHFCATKGGGAAHMA
ncbi:HipA N-terminal domain-containing protein [Bordetella flabilis]|uniref:HipA N-terminal domain-containing protein n=1 Tax=Bordetella flabilis TaxID=463014 RepID=UPI0039EE4CCB